METPIPAEEWVVRSVYVQGFPEDTNVSAILSLVTTGLIESVQFLPEKRCAYVLFLSYAAAQHFYADTQIRMPTIRGRVLEFELLAAPPVAPAIAAAVANGACRNVYLGEIPEEVGEADIRIAVEKFGQIESVRISPMASVAFVHYLSITSASAAVAYLATTCAWASRCKIAYGKDRSLRISKTQKMQALLYLGLNPEDRQQSAFSQYYLANTIAQMTTAALLVACTSSSPQNIGNRSIYLGNIPREARTDDICNSIRGGLVQRIRYFPEKGCAFVTFCDPIDAAQFYATWNIKNFFVLNQQIRVGWAPHSGRLPTPIANALAKGATRNMYLGNVPGSMTEKQLRSDFGVFGEIEQINFLRGRSCAFVNFTDIESALLATSKLQLNTKYKNTRIRYGKDRCCQPPKFQNFPANLPMCTAGPAMLQYLSGPCYAPIPFWTPDSERVSPYQHLRSNCNF